MWSSPHHCAVEALLRPYLCRPSDWMRNRSDGPGIAAASTLQEIDEPTMSVHQLPAEPRMA